MKIGATNSYEIQFLCYAELNIIESIRCLLGPVQTGGRRYVPRFSPANGDLLQLRCLVSLVGKW